MNIPTFSKNSDPSLRKLDRFIEWFLLTIEENYDQVGY